MDNFKKVQTGQRLQIPAEAYNAFLDAARAERSRRHNREQDTTPSFRQADIILVRNDSGSNRARFDVLGLSAPVVAPTANVDQFKNQVALVGVVPVAADHTGKFAVLLEPLEAGAIGRAWVAGVCPARVNVSDPCHEFADAASDATALQSVPRGAARILWREGGLGVQWAVVRLGNSPAPLRRFKLLGRLDRCGSAAAQRVVYGESVGGNPIWCQTDCDFTVFDALGVVPEEGAAGGSFGWAIWLADSGKWEVVALGEGCCGSSSSSGSSGSSGWSSSGSSSGSESSGSDSGSSSGPGSSVTVQETDVRCENDKLNVYKRTVTITLTNHQLSQTTGPWEFSHQAGCCCCDHCSGSSSGAPGSSSSSGSSSGSSAGSSSGSSSSSVSASSSSSSSASVSGSSSYTPSGSSSSSASASGSSSSSSTVSSSSSGSSSASQSSSDSSSSDWSGSDEPPSSSSESAPGGSSSGSGSAGSSSGSASSGSDSGSSSDSGSDPGSSSDSVGDPSSSSDGGGGGGGGSGVSESLPDDSSSSDSTSGSSSGSGSTSGSGSGSDSGETASSSDSLSDPSEVGGPPM